jgi:hypothetical protein
VPRVAFELYGVARLRAGVAGLAVEAATLGEALDALARERPELAGAVIGPGGALHPAYRISLDGRRFLDDPAEPLPDPACLLLLSADVGG